MEQARNPHIFRLLSITILFFAGLAYGAIAMSSGNLFWFLSNAELSEPTRILIIDHGETTVITPEDIRFAALSEAVAESVSNIDNNDLIQIGLSDITLEDYRTNSVVMEIHYPRPISFNTPFRAGNPTKLLIPIEGRHAGTGVFFRGQREDWWFGGMRMADPTILDEALLEIGYSISVGQDRANNS